MSKRDTVIVDHGLTVYPQGEEWRWSSEYPLTADGVAARIGVALLATSERLRQLHAIRWEMLRVAERKKTEAGNV